MKLIMAVIRDHDADNVTRALTMGEFRVTRVASTGGLLKRGVVTFLIGLEDDRVDAAIDVIHKSVGTSSAEERRATIFVLHVDCFTQV
jgi:uncharacterized protein YaaQ